MRVMSFDLECSGLNSDFGIILCGCSMIWRDGKARKGDVVTYRIDDYKGYATKKWDDRQLCNDIRDELETADIIVGWNSRRFDVPYLNGRLMYWGDRTMNKIKHIDLMYQARYKLKMHSSRLAAVQSFLGLPDEKSEMKPQMWMRAVTGEKKSMDYIVDHCIRDVMVLDEAFDKLKHFVNVVYA